MTMELRKRPRRLRTDAGIRRLVAENTLTVDDLIWPLFVHAGSGVEDVASMPGVARLDAGALLHACGEAVAAGIPVVALFPAVAPQLRTADGREACNDKGLVQQRVRLVKERFPELLVLADVALDPYTDHGHDGLLTASGEIDNDGTVAVLVEQALSLAAAGADIIAPSDMMDGRIGAIRDSLERNGLTNTKIMAYAAKYASGFYGPFRDAVSTGSRLRGDKKTYQMDTANLKEALREMELDVAEGADMLMVKPGMPYLDVVRMAASRFRVPVFAYQVSGEYAMLEAAAANGWLDGERVMLETLLGFKRAGCAGILTYFALRAARVLASARMG